jgi:hypothetical protein
MSVIHVEPLGGRHFHVAVSEEAAPEVAGRSFTFRVTVDDAVLAPLGLDDGDPARLAALVRESFGFLLAREPASAILASFELSVISRYFPDYIEEIRPRVR